MTTYLVKYQILKKEEWYDSEKIVVADDDAREAIQEVVVDIIARGIAFDESRKKILE